MDIDEKNGEYSRGLVALLKGVVDRREQLEIWNTIKENQPRIQDYVNTIGLELYVDDCAGYAYIRQRDVDGLPRLVARHQLSYGLSILLVQLRKCLGDFDASNGDRFLLLSKEDIQLRMKGFYPQITNETKYINEIDRHIKKAVEMGFLSEIPGQEDTYEVRELIRSFVTADWLKLFNERLNDYIEFGAKQAFDSEDNTLLI